MADLPLGLPTPPIDSDEVLLGSQGQVAQAVAVLDSDMIITSDDAHRLSGGQAAAQQPLPGGRPRAVDHGVAPRRR
jgi:hypothetical protein